MGEEKQRINKKLLPMKGYFFLFNAGTAPVIPFLSLYAKQLGFSSFIVGLIYTILPVTGMLCKPIAGAIADRFFIQKPMFLFSGLVVAAGFISIYYSPSVPLQRTVNFSCEGIAEFNNCFPGKSQENITLGLDPSKTAECKMKCPFSEKDWEVMCNEWIASKSCSKREEYFEFSAHLPLSKTVKLGKCIYFRVDNVTIDDTTRKVANCVNRIASTCEITCNDARVNELTTIEQFDDTDVLGSYQFWLFLFLMTITWDAMAIVVSVGDTICFELLGDQPSKYGAQRCFGALGWGIITIIAGLIVDHVSKGEPTKNYLPAFVMAAVILVFNFICCNFIKYTQQVYDTNIFKGVAKLLTNIRVVVFMIWCMFIGLCTGLMWNFYLWLVAERAVSMDSSADWISTLQGILLAVQTLVGELPFFWISGWLLKKIGHIQAMNLILLVFGIRLVLYSVITNPWYYIPIDVCNGFTFGIFYAAMTSYASIIAPPGAATTVQGLVGALFEGVGVSLGSLISGTLMEEIGGPLTFRYFGICSLVMCLIHFFVQLMLKQKQNEEDITARYATPVDALSMLSDDTQELQLIR